MTTRKQSSDLSTAIASLQAKRAEIDERIRLVEQAEQARGQLLAHVQKMGATRSDVMWVYGQLPLVRLSRAARLKRVATKYAMKKKKPGPWPPKNSPKTELQPFAEKLRSQRIAKGLSLRELGDKIDRHPSVLSGYEKGKWKAPPDMIAKLEKFYGVTLPKYPSSNGEK